MFALLFLLLIAFVAAIAVAAALVQFRRDGYRRTPAAPR